MQTTLSAAAIATVKATVPALREHGLAISIRLYERLFEDPDVRALFNPARHGPDGAHPKALTAAVIAYAENVDNLAALAGPVEIVAGHHVRAGVTDVHYEMGASALLGAMTDVLGEAATPQVLDAWADAYWLLVRALQAQEATIRAARLRAA